MSFASSPAKEGFDIPAQWHYLFCKAYTTRSRQDCLPVCMGCWPHFSARFVSSAPLPALAAPKLLHISNQCGARSHNHPCELFCSRICWSLLARKDVQVCPLTVMKLHPVPSVYNMNILKVQNSSHKEN